MPHKQKFVTQKTYIIHLCIYIFIFVVCVLKRSFSRSAKLTSFCFFMLYVYVFVFLVMFCVLYHSGLSLFSHIHKKDFFLSSALEGPIHMLQVTNQSELTCLSVFRLRFALHLVVHRHHSDGVLCVRLQVLQDGGGGGSRHLVLVEEKEKQLWTVWTLGFRELWEKQYPRKKEVWQTQKDSQTERCHSLMCCEPSFLGCSFSQ